MMSPEDKEASPSEVQVETLSNNDANIGMEDEVDFKFTIGKILALVSLVIGFSADVFVGVASSAVLTTINEDLGSSPNYIWMVSSNYVAVSVLSPFVGRLGDIFGRRNILIAGNLIAGIGNIIAASAHSVNTVIGGVVLIGVGSAGHQVAWSCIGEVVPRNCRPVAIGVFEASVTPLSITGALIAYALVEHATWRWIFWINVILNFAALLLVVLFYHPVGQVIMEEGKTRREQLKSLDWVGLSLFSAGLVLFLLGLSFGGGKYPWVSAGTLAPLLVGFAVLVACGFWEAYTSNHYNLFPHSVMRNFRGFTIPIGVTFLVGMLYYSTLILWPEEIQVLFSENTTTAGLYSMAIGLGGGVGAALSGFLFKRINHGRLLLLAVVSAQTLCSGLQAVLTPGSHVASTLLVVLLGALGSAATVATNTMVQLNIPHQYLGVAMGLVVTARNVGGSISTTIYTSILSNDLGSNLGTNIATALAKAGVPLADVPAVTGALATGNLTSPALELASPAAIEAGAYALKLSYVHAFRLVYLTSITFGGFGMMCALFTSNFGHLLTTKVDIKLKEGAYFMETADEKTGGHVIAHDGTELELELE